MILSLICQIFVLRFIIFIHFKSTQCIPILLCDPISFFLFILVNLPGRVHISIYRKLINFVFRLVYTQNILVLITNTKQVSNVSKLKKKNIEYLILLQLF
jgi:hypothetical protein